MRRPLDVTEYSTLAEDKCVKFHTKSVKLHTLAKIRADLGEYYMRKAYVIDKCVKFHTFV